MFNAIFPSDLISSPLQSRIIAAGGSIQFLGCYTGMTLPYGAQIGVITKCWRDAELLTLIFEGTCLIYDSDSQSTYTINFEDLQAPDIAWMKIDPSSFIPFDFCLK